MNVLSLFGGIECGRIALDRAGIKIDSYFSSEIDPYAIKITKANYPEIVHVGDVRNIAYEGGKLLWDKSEDDGCEVFGETWTGKIDILIGGSPCQDLSIAKQGGQGLKGEKSSLFFEFVRILEETSPRYWLLENVASMKKEDRDEISKVLGVEPIMINSSLVSAQNRKRLYWTNIPGITQPEDRGIFLRDILEDIPHEDPRWKPLDEKYLTERVKLQLQEKAYCLDASYGKGAETDYFKKGRRTIIVGVLQKERGFNDGGIVQGGEKSPTVSASEFQHNNHVIARLRGSEDIRVYSDQEKSPTLTSLMGTGGNNVPILIGNTNPSGHGMNGCIHHIEGKSPTLTTNKGEGLKITDGYFYRKLTPIECERLQTLPDDYTAHVSNSRRYKAIGNGWTVEIIRHVLSFLPPIH